MHEYKVINNTILFEDGYIKRGKDGGYTCAGETAVESGIIIRKTGCTLEQYAIALNNQYRKICKSMLHVNGDISQKQ